MSNKKVWAGVAALALSSATMAADMSDVLRFQRDLMAMQQTQENVAQLIRNTKNQLSKKLIQLHYDFYSKMKVSSVVLENPTDAVNKQNASRKQTGVWPITISEERDGGMFIVTYDLASGYEPAFALKGVGLVTLSGYIRDSNFEQTGTFNRDCLYEIYVHPKSRKYKCSDVLSGSLDAKIESDMETMLAESMNEQEQRRRQNQ